MFWNGIPGSDRLRLAVRPDTEGAVAWSLNSGEAVSGTSVAATQDGVVSLEITGLSPATVYDYTLTTQDGTERGSCKTFPDDGDVIIVFLSCQKSGLTPAQQIMAENPLVVINIGDENYQEISMRTDNATALSVDSHYAHKRGQRGSTGNLVYKTRLQHTVGYGAVLDDHDAFLNDVFDDVADINARVATLNLSEEEWTTVKENIGTSANAYNIARPPTVGSDDVDPLYFSFECGNTEVFVLSQVIPTMTTMRPVETGNPLLTNNQRDWLYAGVAASTKKYKLILSPKPVIRNSLDNGGVGHWSNNDTWADYNDADTVFQYLHDNQGAWAVPGGLILGTGDQHTPMLHAPSPADRGYDLVQAQCCPSGMFDDVRFAGTYGDTTKFQLELPQTDNNVTNNSEPRFQSYGLYKSHDDYCEIICRSVSGFNIFSGAVKAGSNALYRPPQKVSI